MTTHYMEEADELCHRIAIIHRGRVVLEGTPADLKSRAQGEHVIEVCLDRAADGMARLLAAQPFISMVILTGEKLRLWVEDPTVIFPLLFDAVQR